MKKRLLALFCVFTLLLALPAAADSGRQQLAADMLYTLGLVEGIGDGNYALDRAPTRLEALVMAIRLSGHEAEARFCTVGHHFTDVPAWADGYAAWAFLHNLTNGVSADRFGTGTADANQCAAMVLRALGYREETGDFTYPTAALTACRLGLLDTAEWAEFTRGDFFDLCLRALTARVKGRETTLVQALINLGAVEQARANALGLGPRTALTPREAADRLSPAVFYFESYDSIASKLDGTHTSNASGFFISADGLALTNQHAIVDSVYSVVTTLSGQQYPIESVLFADKHLDVALVRVSRTSLDGQTDAVFPYLTLQHSDTVHNGDPVYAIGSPLGLQNSISAGIVSSHARKLEGFTNPIIQNTANIAEGSSGGPLLNQYGEVIGITSAYFLKGPIYIAVTVDPVFDLDWDAKGVTLAEFHKNLPEDQK